MEQFFLVSNQHYGEIDYRERISMVMVQFERFLSKGGWGPADLHEK
jgi:hypothetical protein